MPDPDRVNEFIDLFTRHEARVHGYVFSLLGDWDAAQDVAAETHAILWRKFDEFDAGTNFFAWACRIARLEVHRYRRERGRDRARFSDAFIDAIADESAALADELAERQRALAECMRKLPPADRAMVNDRYVAGGSVKAIASRVNRSADAVYKALSRIRGSLHSCIERALKGEASP